ncbi:MAG TPA: hypothetical protein VLB51_09655 [Methylomirabilota bacterium]|nr:hypothetical protein [Methylomirabilota bacterium]
MMRPAVAAAVMAAIAVASGAVADDRRWENPIFATVGEAVAAARIETGRLDADSPPALGLFVDMTLAEGDVAVAHPSTAMARTVVEPFLVTHPRVFLDDEAQRRTVERFLAEVPRQRALVAARLERFGYPELPGLVFLRLVDSVDAFAHMNRTSSDRMSRVGGVTYYCRYVVLPLSYVGSEALAELRRSAARNPNLDVAGTVRRWQSESFASLVNTFRHELVHVHTNSALGVPAYSNRSVVPTWFHEGTATYLAGDPHAGLSSSYQEFQEAFFYLAQRYGIGDLGRFYAAVLGGREVATALAEVYGLAGSDELFAASARWHRTKDVAKTVLWAVGLVIVVAAFRGGDRPYIGALQLLAGVALALAVATGLAEHLYGLRGAGFVLAAKAGFGAAALVLVALGVRRILRHRRLRTDAG